MHAPDLDAPFSLLLGGGDRRSIGTADVVAAQVRREPGRFRELWACLESPDPVLRMRAADALEKISRTHPALFAPHKRALLQRRHEDGTPELRWNLLAILPRLALTGIEARQAIAVCRRLFDADPSRIVRVTALQAAHDLAAAHPSLAAPFGALLEAAVASGVPSVAARARRLAPRS